MEDRRIERLTPAQVAKVLNKSPEYIRAGLRQNKFPFGIAVQGKTGKWSYMIMKKRFLEYIK